MLLKIRLNTQLACHSLVDNNVFMLVRGKVKSSKSTASCTCTCLQIKGKRSWNVISKENWQDTQTSRLYYHHHQDIRGDSSMISDGISSHICKKTYMQLINKSVSSVDQSVSRKARKRYPQSYIKQSTMQKAHPRNCIDN